MAVPPTAKPQRLGVLAGDLAGFPNGRRLADDVIDISLQAVMGAAQTGELVPALADGDKVNTNEVPFGASFPYVALPHTKHVNRGPRSRRPQRRADLGTEPPGRPRHGDHPGRGARRGRCAAPRHRRLPPAPSQQGQLTRPRHSRTAITVPGLEAVLLRPGHPRRRRTTHGEDLSCTRPHRFPARAATSGTGRPIVAEHRDHPGPRCDDVRRRGGHADTRRDHLFATPGPRAAGRCAERVDRVAPGSA